MGNLIELKIELRLSCFDDSRSRWIQFELVPDSVANDDYTRLDLAIALSSRLIVVGGIQFYAAISAGIEKARILAKKNEQKKKQSLIDKRQLCWRWVEENFLIVDKHD